MTYIGASKLAKCSEGEVLKRIAFANGEISLSLVKSEDKYYCYLSFRDKICQINESTNIEEIRRYFTFFFKSLNVLPHVQAK